MTTQTPTYRPARLIRRRLLGECRFFGLHQLWFALLITPPITYALALGFDPTGWWLVLVGFVLPWGLVEAMFLPRRLLVWRLAAWESQDDRRRQALRHGVDVEAVQPLEVPAAMPRRRTRPIASSHEWSIGA